MFLITYGALGSSLMLTPWVVGVLISSLMLESLKRLGITGKSFSLIGYYKFLNASSRNPLNMSWF